MKLNDYTVRLCRKEEYDKLIAFLHDYWNPNHVFCRNKEIFEFQHGEGENGTYDFVIAVNNETQDIHAVLGFIRLSQYSNKFKNNEKVIYGALWKARNDVKDKESGKLGLAILQYLMHSYPDCIYATLGLSLDSQTVYKGLHFNFGKMNHYYIASRYCDKFLIAENPFVNKQPNINNEYSIKEIKKIPQGFDPYYYPEKDEEYVRNRYLNHPYYHYRLIGIFRKDELFSVWIIRDVEVENSKCLRIVDMLGNIGEIKDINGNIQEFLKENEAEYIDCYNHGIDEGCFVNMGFRIKGEDEIIPNYFEPFEKRNVDIFYAYSGNKEIVIFKADGDQDRPNLLGI